MKLRVVICGGSGGEAWLAVQAWLAAGSHDDVALYSDDPALCAARAQALGVVAIPDRAALLDDGSAAIVHLLGGLHSRDDLLRGLLERGCRVVVAPPLWAHGDRASLVAAAAPRLLRDGSLVPWLPAFGEGLSRVHANHIGRLQQLRLRAVIAGRGGWDAGLSPDCPLREPLALPGFEDLLRRELAAALPLSEAVLGPIIELHVQAPRREPPYTVITTWRHRGHARHGTFELTVSPEQRLRSPFAARDDSLEITGTAGILWVGGLRGGPSMVPPLRIYRGDTLLEPEPPRGGWPAAWRHMVRSAPVIDLAQLHHRLVCLEAAVQSANSGRRVSLR